MNDIWKLRAGEEVVNARFAQKLTLLVSVISTGAEYVVSYSLTKEDLEAFLEQGGSYFDALAKRISENEADYRSRGLTVPV